MLSPCSRRRSPPNGQAIPSEHYRQLEQRFGGAVYERIDAPANAAQKKALANLSPEMVRADAWRRAHRAGSRARPATTRPLGGLKVITENGWFAARPSGTEDVYKIYAESFLGADHLRKIQSEARAIVDDAFAAGLTSRSVINKHRPFFGCCPGESHPESVTSVRNPSSVHPHLRCETEPPIPGRSGRLGRQPGRCELGLLDVLVHQLRHLEHRYLALAAEDRLELGVGVDHPAVLRVLQLVLLDVVPHLLRELGAGQVVLADDSGELAARLDRLGDSASRHCLAGLFFAAGAFLAAFLVALLVFFAVAILPAPLLGGCAGLRRDCKACTV
jgi:hypothetical protein